MVIVNFINKGIYNITFRCMENNNHTQQLINSVTSIAFAEITKEENLTKLIQKDDYREMLRHYCNGVLQLYKPTAENIANTNQVLFKLFLESLELKNNELTKKNRRTKTEYR